VRGEKQLYVGPQQKNLLRRNPWLIGRPGHDDRTFDYRAYHVCEMIQIDLVTWRVNAGNLFKHRAKTCSPTLYGASVRISNGLVE